MAGQLQVQQLKELMSEEKKKSERVDQSSQAASEEVITTQLLDLYQKQVISFRRVVKNKAYRKGKLDEGSIKKLGVLLYTAFSEGNEDIILDESEASGYETIYYSVIAQIRANTKEAEKRIAKDIEDLSGEASKAKERLAEDAKALLPKALEEEESLSESGADLDDKLNSNEKEEKEEKEEEEGEEEADEEEDEDEEGDEKDNEEEEGEEEADEEEDEDEEEEKWKKYLFRKRESVCLKVEYYQEDFYKILGLKRHCGTNLNEEIIDQAVSAAHKDCKQQDSKQQLNDGQVPSYSFAFLALCNKDNRENYHRWLDRSYRVKELKDNEELITLIIQGRVIFSELLKEYSDRENQKLLRQEQGKTEGKEAEGKINPVVIEYQATLKAEERFNARRNEVNQYFLENMKGRWDQPETIIKLLVAEVVSVSDLEEHTLLDVESNEEESVITMLKWYLVEQPPEKVSELLKNASSQLLVDLVGYGIISLEPEHPCLLSAKLIKRLIKGTLFNHLIGSGSTLLQEIKQLGSRIEAEKNPPTFTFQPAHPLAAEIMTDMRSVNNLECMLRTLKTEEEKEAYKRDLVRLWPSTVKDKLFKLFIEQVTLGWFIMVGSRPNTEGASAVAGKQSTGMPLRSLRTTYNQLLFSKKIESKEESKEFKRTLPLLSQVADTESQDDYTIAIEPSKELDLLSGDISGSASAPGGNNPVQKGNIKNIFDLSDSSTSARADDKGLTNGANPYAAIFEDIFSTTIPEKKDREETVKANDTPVTQELKKDDPRADEAVTPSFETSTPLQAPGSLENASPHSARDTISHESVVKVGVSSSIEVKEEKHEQNAIQSDEPEVKMMEPPPALVIPSRENEEDKQQNSFDNLIPEKKEEKQELKGDSPRADDPVDEKKGGDNLLQAPLDEKEVRALKEHKRRLWELYEKIVTFYCSYSLKHKISVNNMSQGKKIFDTEDYRILACKLNAMWFMINSIERCLEQESLENYEICYADFYDDFYRTHKEILSRVRLAPEGYICRFQMQCQSSLFGVWNYVKSKGKKSEKSQTQRHVVTRVEDFFNQEAQDGDTAFMRKLNAAGSMQQRDEEYKRVSCSIWKPDLKCPKWNHEDKKNEEPQTGRYVVYASRKHF